MKALSIKQPWASAVVMGQRKGEPRLAAPDHGFRGALLIHAPQNPAPAINNRWVMRRLERANALMRMSERGALIGTVELVGVTDLATTDRADLEHWRKHYPDRVLWSFRHPMVFREAIPCRGAPGLFEIDDAIVAGAIIDSLMPADYMAWRNATQKAMRNPQQETDR